MPDGLICALRRSGYARAYRRLACRHDGVTVTFLAASWHRGNVVRACSASLAAIALCAASLLGACASSPSASGHRADTQRLANSPEAAALGFDEVGKYLCPDVTEISTVREDPQVPTKSVATVVSSDDGRWVIDVQYVAGSEALGSTRYEVHHRVSGYCVTDQLPSPPPSQGTSSDGAPGSHRPSSSPHR